MVGTCMDLINPFHLQIFFKMIHSTPRVENKTTVCDFLPLDFVLCASTKAAKRIQGITKNLDKRTCGYRRRQKDITKATDHSNVYRIILL